MIDAIIKKKLGGRGENALHRLLWVFVPGHRRASFPLTYRRSVCKLSCFSPAVKKNCFPSLFFPMCSLPTVYYHLLPKNERGADISALPSYRRIKTKGSSAPGIQAPNPVRRDRIAFHCSQIPADAGFGPRCSRGRRRPLQKPARSRRPSGSETARSPWSPAPGENRPPCPTGGLCPGCSIR